MIALSADHAFRYDNLADIIGKLRRTHKVAGWCDCIPAPDGTPASAGVQFVRDYGLDYFIGQAESAAQFDAAVAVGAKVVVGNITALRQDQIDRLGKDVFLIQEDYWNEGWGRANDPRIAAFCAGVYPAIWWPTIKDYRDAGRWRDGDGLFHVSAVQDWASLP